MMGLSIIIPCALQVPKQVAILLGHFLGTDYLFLVLQSYFYREWVVSLTKPPPLFTKYLLIDH